MKYRTNPQNGDEISALSFGCMRLPRDEKESRKLIVSAIENGVNYFDTAYIYPNNEALLGRIMPKEYRSKIKIATKLPPYFVRGAGDFKKIFNTQLDRLKTDYIDYYFMHMLVSKDEWERLCSLGALDFIKEEKSRGRIKNLGFSYHGGLDGFTEIIDAYDWEFCMLQYNYFDENNQTGRKGVEYATAKGVPVIAMEPLRGGSLAQKERLPKAALVAFDNSGKTPAEWGLRWILNQPGILTVLSGMNTPEALAENIRVASEMEPDTLTEKEFEVYAAVKKSILDNTYVGCTGCGYCMPCPQKVDIPLCFSCYNDIKLVGKMKARFYYIMRTHKRDASRCTKCGKCEKHCPQGIVIRDELDAAAKAFGGFPYRPGRWLVRRIMRLS